MFWSVDPVLLEVNLGGLGHLQVRWYGAFFATAFLFGYAVIARFFRKEGKPAQDIDKLLFTMVFGTIVGARLGHCLFYEPDYYLSRPIEIIMVWHGGLASHGAFIGVLLSLYYYSRSRPDQSFLWLTDRVSLAVPLGGALIRLGNLFNSEILGKPTEGIWGVVFTRFDRLPRHPTQVYESLSYLVVAVVLFYLVRRFRALDYRGLIFGSMMVLIFGVRFVIEFTKEFQTNFESDLPLTMGQLLSIPVVIFGVFLIIKSRCPLNEKGKAKEIVSDGASRQEV